MLAFAIVALAFSCFQFAVALFALTADMDKTYKMAIGEKGIRIPTLELRDLTPQEKRRRFLWIALAALPVCLFLLLFIIS